MDDKLEKFVLENRSDFDSEVPGEKVWEGIIVGVKPDSGYHVWWKVAAVIFLISTAYLLLERHLDQEVNYGSASEMTEFAQVEDYYVRLIGEKKAEISRYGHGLLERDFLLEIDRLDQMYGELKNTYNKQSSSDMLTDAMINNLKLRIDILNQQIKILEKLKENENVPGVEI